MIVAKPKVSTLTSLLLFLFALSASLAWVIRLYWFEGVRNMWISVSLGLLLPTTLLLFGKVILGYRILRIDKDKIMLTYPFKFRSYILGIKDLESWKESVVKTGSGLFKELQIKFKQKQSFKISNQEHTDYDKVFKYLERKAKNLFVEEK
jgi:hypothetical protein